jgi:magnesium chelatase subunit I
MSITAYENLLSTAERRALKAGTNNRSSDFMGIIPAITGKVELVYEGEQEGAAFVAKLIGSAIHTFFPGYFPKSKTRKAKRKTAYSDLIEWFLLKVVLNCLTIDSSDEEYERILGCIVRNFNQKIPTRTT